MASSPYSEPPTAGSPRPDSRMYRAIKAFLIVVVVLLVFELVAYFKGWRFSLPTVRSAEVVDFVGLVYANWLEIRAKYLAPALQSMTNVCVILFLVLLVDRIILVLGCFWIKFRRLKPVAEMEYSTNSENVNAVDYPMVLVQIPMCNEREIAEAEDDQNTKRTKSTEGNGSEKGSVKTEAETKGTSNGAGDEGPKPAKANPIPPEPPKDYIHVRARRGQATDSHSLAERVRREKISERMKLLQDLVPGCNKVTGKALMLDEIINYVQSLQRQVEFLSMKLSSVNPRLDFNMDSLFSKEVLQPNGSLPHPMYPLDSSASAFFGHQTREIPQVHTKLSNRAVTQCSVDPVDSRLFRNLGFQFPQVDEFGQGLPPIAEAEDDQNTKRTKSTEGNGSKKGSVKTEAETKGTSNGAGDEGPKPAKANPNPPEPPKDQIHVRARRGQATDSHSLSERVRREKISERMKRLQDLVPGCNKVTGKALMLDEIINYVQSLQRQVEIYHTLKKVAGSSNLGEMDLPWLKLNS